MKKRRTNADVLKVPNAALRKIKQVSADSRMPLHQVFEDVLENGLLTIAEMYRPMVEFRKTRDAKWKEQYEPHTQAELPDEEDNGQPGLSGEIHGSGCSGSDFGVRPVGEGLVEYAGDGDAITEGGLATEPPNAYELSGFGEQDQADLGMADSAVSYGTH